MNFEKCCILSFPKEEPISALPPPWNKMKPSSSAIYLGVNISTKGKLEDIWAAPMAKARKVARNISGHDFPLTSRIYLINTFLISLFQYLFRFFLFPVPFFQELSKLIRRSLYPTTQIPNSLLFSHSTPLSLHPSIRHPYLSNIATLLSIASSCPSPPKLPAGLGWLVNTLTSPKCVRRIRFLSYCSSKISEKPFAAKDQDSKKNGFSK